MAGTKELIKDGLRGRPDVDLRAWAASRGLDFRGHSAQLGYLGAFAPSEELQFNVVRGRLPGGETGVLLHEVKVYEEGTAGTFYGVRTKGKFHLRNLIEGSDAYFRVPFTTAAVRVPESIGTVWGLHVSRRSERGPAGAGWEERRRLTELGLKPWEAWVRKDADAEVIDAVLEGPVRAALAGEPPLGLAVTIRAGLVKASRQHFLKEDAELDAFSTALSTLARGVREICSAAARPRPFATELEPPYWLEQVAARLQDANVGVYAQDLGAVVRFAGERGLAVEDPREFHRAFPHLATPGEAFGVFRGPLPGTGVPGRLVTCVERHMRHPTPLEDMLPREAIAFDVGGDAALLPVRPGIPDTPDPDGERHAGLRLAVRDGILVVSGLRSGWQLVPADLDRLAAEAVRLARERGLLES